MGEPVRTHGLVMRSVEISHRIPDGQKSLAGVECVGAGVVHRLMSRIHVTGQDVVHHAGVIMPIGGSGLKDHLVLRRDDFIACVIPAEYGRIHMWNTYVEYEAWMEYGTNTWNTAAG